MQNDLKFSGSSPVVIDYNGDTTDIYAPVKTSSCDVNIVSDTILDDLYTASLNEIGVTIGKLVQKKEKVVTISNGGSIESTQINTTSDEYYNIDTRTLFFTDINGTYRFNGKVKKPGSSVLLNGTLKYNQTTKKWENSDTWKLNWDDWYFWCGRNSYRVRYNGSNHTINVWQGTDWGTNDYIYVKNNGSSDSDCAYKPDNYIHFSDSDLELIWNTERYTWNQAQLKWLSATPYSDVDGGSFVSMAGSTYHKIKDRDGNWIHTVLVNGYYNSTVSASNWVVKLDRTNNTYKRVIPFKSGWDDLDHIFTGDNGDLYYIETSGDIYYWSWVAEEWVKWVTFTGDVQSGTFDLDYVIPGTHNSIVVKYYNTSNQWEYTQLTNIVAPTVSIEYVPIPGEYETEIIWEGYKLPNTYSQEVTQNLDTINMTCIDPVSIMKYVKIDKILTKPAILSYGELIGKAIAYVKLHCNRLIVENTVTYGSQFWTGDNGLLELRLQVSNFWNEAGEPDTIYKMLEEMLRPFCLTLSFVDNAYQIYNANKTTGTRVFEEYTIEDDGTLTYVQEFNEDEQLYDYDEGDWVSNNTQNATIEINNTYGKVTGTASTSVPNYSKMAIDLIDYNMRDMYDAGWLNVQRNKTKGYVKRNNTVTTDTTDRWFYLWNGAYANPDYELVPWGYNPGDEVEWYVNCNQAYQYLYNASTPSADHGSILNFYGGSNNPTATGKYQDEEKSVEISKRITAYAADNGVPPEFLELSDLDWSGHKSGDELTINKKNTSNSKFGDGIYMDDSDWVIYHQEYQNINMNMSNNPVIQLDMVRCFSRTGINVPIEVMNNNTATGVDYNIWGNFTGFDNSYYFPQPWNAENVIVNSIYFRRYAGSGTIRVKPVWDMTRVDMYIQTSDNRIFQFNGKEWVEDTEVKESNAFYLKKLMNFEHLYYTDHRYNVIETSDGQNYSLTDEPYVYYTKTYSGEEYVNDSDSGTRHEYAVYNTGVFEPVSSSCEGRISIILPRIDDAAPVVYVDIYNSTMLGMTGSDDIGGAFTGAPFYYANGGGEYTGNVYIDFLPKNLSHVKGEHVDLNISITVPKSNLGQMFSQSDIEYDINSDQNFIEEYSGPSFQVNTYNQLVASSFSYLLFGNSYADPGEFVISGIAARPECYTVQAYFNWLSFIRKIYMKTIVPKKDSDRQFSNARTLIWSPEVGGQYLMVISDSWDMKTNRHSITAIESDQLDVRNVGVVDAVEIPRRARAERWNLPTATK